MNGRVNIDQLELAVIHLEEIIQEVAFVGGTTVALLITDEAAPAVNTSAWLSLQFHTDSTARMLVVYVLFIVSAIVLNGKSPCAIISS